MIDCLIPRNPIRPFDNRYRGVSYPTWSTAAKFRSVADSQLIEPFTDVVMGQYDVEA